MKRKQNQDNFLLLPELDLYIVADGMGGHLGGEIASLLAVNTIADYFRAVSVVSTGEGTVFNAVHDPAQKLLRSISAANQAILSKGQADAALHGMGTTTTALHFTNDRLFIGHVGDSRAYLIHSRPERIWQLTRDHSLVQEKIRAGLITRLQAKTDRMKNVITRSVGFENDLDVDVYEYEPKKNDVFVVCSDGLSGMVDDEHISAIVQEAVFQNNSLDLAVEKLIAAANAGGGDDNVTALVLQVL